MVGREEHRSGQNASPEGAVLPPGLYDEPPMINDTCRQSWRRAKPGRRPGKAPRGRAAGRSALSRAIGTRVPWKFPLVRGQEPPGSHVSPKTIAHILGEWSGRKINPIVTCQFSPEGFNRRMRILPVLDLMKGLVVRAQGGRRKEYRPLISGLIRSSHPLDVAQAFRFHFGLKELYLADLDAIAGRPPALQTYTSLRKRGFQLWLEPGIKQAPDAEKLAEAGIETIIGGLETLAGPEV